MASRREYEMLFQLNAQLGGSYNSTFKSAQNSITQMQKEIEALSKIQSNISAYEKQQGAIEVTRKKLEVLQQQYNNIQKEIDETGTYSSDLENKLLQKQQQIDKTSDSIEIQTEKLNRMGNALRQAGVNTETLTSDSAKLGSQIDVIKQKQEVAAAKANNFGAVASTAFNAVGEAIATAGITRLLNEIADGFMNIADASVKFESGITGVEKTTDLSESELAALSKDIKDLSADIPVTTDELNEITEAAGQLGIAKDDLLEFTEVMANLGVATNLSSIDASTALAKFANVVKMSADDYGRLGATIVELGNKSASTESEIVSMATRLASTGALIGLSEPDIMAVASALSSLGIEAEAGGSAISKLLKQFEVMVQTGAPELVDFAKVAGMSAEEFSVAWGENSVKALAKFVDGLGQIDAAGGSSVAKLEELGITEIRLSNAVLSLASSGGILTDTLRTANAAWEDNTALTKEAEKRYATTESQLKMMQNEYNNLKIAIGDNYTPTLKELYQVGKEVLGDMTEFVQQNPALVKAVTAFVGVVGAATAGLTAYVAITKIAIPLMQLFAASIPGVNIIMGVTLGVAALTAGIVALANITKSEKEEIAELTAVSREQYKQMRELQDEYDEVKETMGETSYEAQVLKSKLDEATKKYEENKQSAEELAESNKDVLASHNALMKSYQESNEGIEKETNSNEALMNKLIELMSVEEKSASTKQEILAVVEMLNKAMPELGLAYDQYTDSLNQTADSIRKVVEAEIAREKNAANYENLKKFIGEESTLYDNLQKHIAETGVAQRELAEAQAAAEAQRKKLGAPGLGDAAGREYAYALLPYIEAVTKASEAVQEATDAEKEAQVAYDENQDTIKNLTESLAGYSEEVAENGGEIRSVINNITEKISDLTAKYEEAYKAALDSIEGQYSIWDNAAKVVATSAGTMNDALESQISYWQKYNENLAGLTNRSAEIEGLSDMLASFADGSADSVNAIAGMAKASDKDLAAMVKNWQMLREEQETVSEKLANLETDFTDSMSVLQKELETSIGKMDLGDEAAQSGKNTIQGFINGAENMIPEVQAAYKRIADAAVTAIDERLEIHSPSKVMWEKGQYAMSGFTGGVEAMEPDVKEVMANAAGSGVNAFSSALSAEHGGGGGVTISLDYSPQYEVSGGNADEIESMLRTHDSNLKDTILDILESAGIDAKRRAYA